MSDFPKRTKCVLLNYSGNMKNNQQVIIVDKSKPQLQRIRPKKFNSKNKKFAEM